MGPADIATQEYTAALAALRTARQRYTAAAVPMDLVDGHPPPLTGEQHAAVIAYAAAWQQFVRARQSVAETGASRPRT